MIVYRKKAMASLNDDPVLSEFNSTIDQWIIALDHYTFEQLCQKPRMDSWSLGQVYMHLIADTRYFVKQIKACLLTRAHEDGEMHEEAKVMFRNHAFPDIRLQNSSADPVPQPDGKAALLREMISIREEVNNLYADDRFPVSTGKTRHPGLGYFTAAEWLEFAEMHLRHHFRQKRHIDTTLYFTGG